MGTIIYTEIVIKQDLINKQSYIEKIDEHLLYLQYNKPTLKLPEPYTLNYKVATVVSLLHKGFKQEANYKINRLAIQHIGRSTTNLKYAKMYINSECKGKV